MMSPTETLLHQFAISDSKAFFQEAFIFTATTHREFLDSLATLDINMFGPKRFLGEYTWVIFTSGFNASIVSAKYEQIARTLSQFDPKKVQEGIVRKGMKIIRHEAKWRAVLDCARTLQRTPWEEFRAEYLSSLDAMEKLPRIGPVTKYHLARNIGFDCVKPDLHLVRAAERFGAASPEHLCRYLQAHHQDGSSLLLSQIDYVIWCYLSHAGKISTCCFNTNIQMK